jgi:hypothetical protein
MGFLGGQHAALWAETSYTEPQEAFRVELGPVVFWPEQANTFLEHAVETSGPWYRYEGETITIHGRRAVFFEPNAPRRFFRPVREP